ncbi:MAG: helix-hairpin-helix domain-containing protein [Bacteroidales bacterium]|nr:helix-hairpin-helix domain-containing protein [Bacteroidales bacterium]
MKKAVLFIIIIIFHKAHCQISNDLIIDHIERMTENSEDEISDYSEMIETYWSIIENPININSDNIEQLAEFKFISIFQLENIKNYRKSFGDFQFIEELYEVDGLDPQSIEIIKPLICFDDRYHNDKTPLEHILKHGKNKILFEVNQCLNEKNGYKEISDSMLYAKPNSIYLGSPQKLYLRYNFSYKDKIEAGFVLEKDPGEYLIRNNINDSIKSLLGKQCYSGFDYSSFHIFINHLGFLKTLAIGDYKISFGQGLTMGNGMSFVARGESLLRRNKKISASKSANEAYYLRGMASTLKYKDLELSVFYSNKKTDANVTAYDSLNETPLEVTSLQQSGLHRTYNEIMDRKVIRQQLYGLNLSYKISDFQIGYTFHKTDLSAKVNPENNIYNLFYFRGKSISNHGLDFYYIFKKIVIYGEAAMSNNKGFAYLIGSTFQPTGYIDFTILYRDYAKDYICLYSNAFASGSNTRNEQGYYFSSALSIAANWKFINSIDFFKNDFFKNTSHSPSHGHEFDSQLNYTPDKNTLMFIEYCNKHKMKNTKDTDIYQRYLIHEKSNVIRFHIEYQITEGLNFKNRIEYHFNYQEHEKSNSYLIYQDILYNSPNKSYNIAFRYELFNTEQGSVYAYENDVLYAFGVGSLSGKGIRTYLVGKIKMMEQIQISGKIGFTFYDDKKVIGSGLESIDNSFRGDGKIQIVWSF